MAVEKKKVIGMVAYHRHSKSRCEMKRLYVKPKYRENKLGKKLVLEILGHAKKAGYKEMVLDTIIPLQVAIHLYKKVGFVECEAYYHNPMDDVLYFKKILLVIGQPITFFSQFFTFFPKQHVIWEKSKKWAIIE